MDRTAKLAKEERKGVRVLPAVFAVACLAILTGLLAQASACVYPDRKRPLPADRLTLMSKRRDNMDGHSGTNGKGALQETGPHYELA